MKCEELEEYSTAVNHLEKAEIVSQCLLYDMPYNPLQVAILEDIARIYYEMGEYGQSRWYQEKADQLRKGQ